MKNKYNQVKFNSLSDDSLIQRVDLRDYFRDEGEQPYSDDPITVKSMKETLEEDEVEFSDIIAGSGDGDSNYVYVTICEGVICTIID